MGIIAVFTEHGDGIIQAAAGITGFGRLAIPVEAAKVDVVKGLADYRLGNGGGELFVVQPVAETAFREIPHQQRMQSDSTFFVIGTVGRLLA